ncbi:MAG: sigma-70 family RNA polymerase sigma factor [Planctomycetaceae bacterium]|nr:sigma-70 family RNA polymerase sigma factor [Planctomycetaceae bacterium]
MFRDENQIKRIQIRDSEALRRLYVEHKDLMLTLANALLHDICQAEDVVQEVFLHLVKNRRSFGAGTNIKAYLTTSVVNQVRSQLRRKKVAVQKDADAELAGLPDPPCRRMEELETAEQLRLHLAELPYEQREVVLLRLKAGLKFKQIAAIQETSIATVQGRYRYGLDRLRSLLNGELNA